MLPNRDVINTKRESKSQDSKKPPLKNLNSTQQKKEPIQEDKVLTRDSKRQGSDEQYELLIKEKIIPLTTEYLDHLKHVKKGFEDKYKKMNSLLACLEDKEKLSSALDRVENFYKKLNKYKKTITEHRDPDWKRYINNGLIAGGILITGILPGLALLLIYVNTGSIAGKSIEFWKSGGQNFFDKSKKHEPTNETLEEKSNKSSKLLNAINCLTSAAYPRDTITIGMGGLYRYLLRSAVNESLRNNISALFIK